METAALLDVDNEIMSPSNTSASKGTRGKRVKRKWREIEQLNEKRRLLKELQEMDSAYDGDLADIEL